MHSISSLAVLAQPFGMPSSTRIYYSHQMKFNSYITTVSTSIPFHNPSSQESYIIHSHSHSPSPSPFLLQYITCYSHTQPPPMIPILPSRAFATHLSFTKPKPSAHPNSNGPYIHTPPYSAVTNRYPPMNGSRICTRNTAKVMHKG